MAGKIGGDGQMMSEVNVTPMVDVMLVLLIIFMVTAPMMNEDDDSKRKVEMDIPVTRNNANVINPNDTDKIILEIDKNLVVMIGEEVITDCSVKLEETAKDRFESCFNEVEAKLAANAKLQEDGEIYLLADTDIPYGFVVGTMARIKAGGIGKVGMITNPEYLQESAETK